MSTLLVKLRSASPEDIPSINAIHRYYVENTVITFVTEPNTNDAMLESYNNIKNEGLPDIVAVDTANKAILGYTYVSAFRGVKPGYRHSLELSLFCHPDHVRRGIGEGLLLRLIEILEYPDQWKDWVEGTRLIEYKPRQLLAVMAIDIEGPGHGLKLRDWYLKYGFVERGRLKEVGWKKERWIDTIYLQYTLEEA